MSFSAVYHIAQEIGGHVHFPLREMLFQIQSVLLHIYKHILGNLSGGV